MKVGEALEEESDSSKDMGHFTYRPRSDFLILNSTFPRVAVEVNSHSPGRPPADRYRMVIQGASVVRYANTYLDAYKDERNFIFMIIFIDGTGEVNRDLLYQTETSNTVSMNFLYDTIKLISRRYIARKKVSRLQKKKTALNFSSNCIISLLCCRTRPTSETQKKR
jgi:hypothetical protein